MTVPSATVRGTPDGIMLPDGFSSKITIGIDDTIEFWEKQVTPPALDGGDSVEQTTMFNVKWRTSLPRDLITLEDITTTVAYDPDIYDELIDTILNVNTTITVTFSDGTTLAFFGFLKRFEPAALVEGEQPEATVTFVATNVDPADGLTEEGPTLVEVAGS